MERWTARESSNAWVDIRLSGVGVSYGSRKSSSSSSFLSRRVNNTVAIEKLEGGAEGCSWHYYVAGNSYAIDTT